MPHETLVQRASNAGVHMVAHEGLGHQVGSLGGIAAAFNSYPAALLTLGTTAAASSVLMQLEYNHECKNIRRLYENELAAKLKKSPGALKNKDLHILAQGKGANLESNQVIADALHSARKRRNFGIGIAIVASLGSLALMAAASVAAPGLAAAATTHGIAHVLSWSGLAQGLVGFLTYQAIKQPLHWISDKLFGLERDTAHDHIIAIHKDRHKGRFITREQVFAVFVAANKELGAMIKSQYGKAYDDLPLAAKQTVSISIGRMIALDKITDAINHGRLNPTELAFTVSGQESGFDPSQDAIYGKSTFAKIKDKLLGRDSNASAHYAVTAPPMPVYSKPEPEPAEHEAAPNKISFVDRLKQSRAAEASLLQQR